MNLIYSSTPREVQTIRCCGHIYKRWRFAGTTNFPRINEDRARRHHGRRATHAAHCAVCGLQLYWPANFEQRDIAAVRAQERRDAYYDRRVTLHLSGLTTQGQPRQRSLLPISRKERNRLMMERYLIRRDKLAAKGLTTRGTKRIIFRREATPVETRWRDLRATVPKVLHIEDYVTSQWENYG